jgi:geranylgeranyl diphosphate synthase type I
MERNEHTDSFFPAVEQVIHTALEKYLNPAFPELKEAIFYQFGFRDENAGKMKGKRIRPLLVLLTADLLSIDWHKVLPAAAAIEMLHNFSLIHDDIEDHSPLRRGKETIWKKWGTGKAINIGDTLFILSVLTMQSIGEDFGAEEALEGSQLFMRTSFSVMQGQQMDMAFEGDMRVTANDYLRMISEKTAALLSFSCEISAVLAGINLEVRKHLRTFGLNLGLAFQIYDDWLGIWGKENQTGKPEFSDLVEKKISYPVLLGNHQSSRFRDLWLTKQPIPMEEIREMAVVLTREGIEAQVLDKATYYNDIAVEALDTIDGKQSAKDVLKSVAEDLIKRKY